MVGPEDRLQIAYFDWVRLKRITDIRYKYIIHPANERKCSLLAGALLKRKGVSKGIPDILCFYPNGGYHGLVIELKSEKGAPSTEQEAWLNMLKVIGWSTGVFKDWLAAAKFTESYFGK